MHDSNSTHDLTAAGSATSASRRRRLIVLLAAILALLLLVFLPPYINVSRFQRRVDRNISASLGRPVHFDRLSLALLPLPGFTLDNFVVDEDPAFGSEPMLRADQVRITLRIASLWRHRIEFSKISFTDPSVNLVHISNGGWNIENLLLQASRTQAAPTAQRFSGPAPRFPYIEATGARLNLKLDQEKTPFSLTDADFALWLPQPHQWRLRLNAHPVRTDTGPADTGTLRVEATLGSPDTGSGNTPTDSFTPSLANLPIDLHGDWQQVQLGGLSRLLVARDAGLRGELTLSVTLLGTLRHNAITSVIQLDNVRRSDFVPPHLLSIDADCRAIAQNTFHTFSNVECDWPPSTSSEPRLLTLTATLPNIRQPRSASATITLPALSADTFLDWLSVATPRPPTGLTGPGILTGTLSWNTTYTLSSSPASDSEQPTRIVRRDASSHGHTPSPQPVWSGEIELSHEFLQRPSLGPKPIPLGDLQLRSSQPSTDQSQHRHGPNPTVQSPSATSFVLLPISLPLGGKQPATLDGHFDAAGYILHLSGSVLPVRLLALGDAIPQLGDGLRLILEPASSDKTSGAVIQSGAGSAQPKVSEQSHAFPAVHPVQTRDLSRETAADPIHIDFTATRTWGDPQTWRQTDTPPPHPHP